MGLISKLASGTIGMTSEAIHHSRRKKDAASDSDPSLTSPDGTQSVEKANILDRARIAKGKETEAASLRTQTTQSSQAGLAESQNSTAAEAGYDDDEYGPDERNQDEAAWELDEAAHESKLPTYEEANQPQYMTLSTNDAAAVKESKKDAMIRALREMAGPVDPEKVQNIPVPVIIPQRRPRFKERGFVRAYAPLLADSGIGQDMFIEFLEVFDKACEVCFLSSFHHCPFIKSRYRATPGSMSFTWPLVLRALLPHWQLVSGPSSSIPWQPQPSNCKHDAAETTSLIE